MNPEERLSALLEKRPGAKLVRMFGGYGYLLNGHMCCGLFKAELIIRVGTDKLEELFKSYPDLRVMDITGRPMKGWGMIRTSSLKPDDFTQLVRACEVFAQSLPPKYKSSQSSS